MAQQSTAHQASVTVPGAKNGGSDRRELYLKLFSGEMFKGFQHNTIARDLTAAFDKHCAAEPVG